MLRWDNRGGFIVLLNLFHAVGKCVSIQLILSKAENSSEPCHVKRGYFRKEYPCKELLSISIWPCDPNVFQIHKRSPVLWGDIISVQHWWENCCVHFLCLHFRTSKRKPKSFQKHCFNNELNSQKSWLSSS